MAVVADEGMQSKRRLKNYSPFQQYPPRKVDENVTVDTVLISVEATSPQGDRIIYDIDEQSNQVTTNHSRPETTLIVCLSVCLPLGLPSLYWWILSIVPHF